MGKQRLDGLYVPGGGQLMNANRTQIANLAVKSRLPVIYDRPEVVESGGLMSYGVEHCRLGPARRPIGRQDTQRHQAR